MALKHNAQMREKQNDKHLRKNNEDQVRVGVTGAELHEGRNDREARNTNTTKSQNTK